MSSIHASHPAGKYVGAVVTEALTSFAPNLWGGSGATDVVESYCPPLRQPRRLTRYRSAGFPVSDVVMVVENDVTSVVDSDAWMRGTTCEFDENSLTLLIGQIVALDMEGRGKNAARLVLKFIESSFARGGLEDVGQLVQRLDAERLSGWTIVAVLRSTYRARNIISAWRPFLLKATAILKARNEPAERILFGLDR